MWKQFVLTLACGVLVACGGGGSGDGANTGQGTVNSPPQIAGTPPVAARVGQAYQFTPSASDADGDVLTFSIQNRPEWATFSPITGRLEGTPPSTAKPLYERILISVSDGKAISELPAFSIQVTSTVTPPANQPPVISGTPATSVNSGQTYSFTPTASDPEGQALTFSISNMPAWASFNSTTGRLSGTPAVANAGTYSGIVISVSDGTTTVSLPAFSIVVTATTGTAELTWTKPTRNEDGTPLTDLAGYKIRYGGSPGALNGLVNVNGADVTSASIEGLAAGTWYFSIASYTSSGAESAPTGTVYVTF